MLENSTYLYDTINNNLQRIEEKYNWFHENNEYDKKLFNVHLKYQNYLDIFKKEIESINIKDYNFHVDIISKL